MDLEKANKRAFKPIALVDIEEAGWETIIDFTAFDERGVSAREVLTALQKSTDKETF